ncbi:MAG: diguanylate cyclase [Acidobacteria bacterium]|nr:diguanylate cyclase [Acidobacteriota bacterium]
MSPKAHVYLGVVIALGAAAIALGVAGWKCEDSLRFWVYLGAALLTSRWKVSLPGIQGTMSANFFYVLIGIVELSLGETMAIAVSSVLLQYLYRAKSKAKLVRAAFNVATIAISALVAVEVFRAPLLGLLSLQFPLRLTLAALAYFLANTVPIATAISVTEGKPVVKTWKDCYFWSLAYYLVGAAGAGILHLMNLAMGWQAGLLVVPVIYLVYRSYSLYLSRLEGEKKQAEIERGHAEKMASLHLRTIEALALAIEAKDQTTHDHLQRVEVYCMEMARMMDLSEEDQRALQAASLLHDIGKLAVPEHILSKPGRLTPEEFEKVKIHPVVGAEILERVQFPYPVVPIVRSHHERWDGNGYPDGIAGEQIPIGARILSAVDCLDALASDRQYRRALPLDKAMEIVSMEAGKTYDPKVVKLLEANYIELEKKAREYTVREGGIKDCRVQRRVEPAAGFEDDTAAQAWRSTAFLDTIGAARQEAQLLFEIAQGLVSAQSLSDMCEGLIPRLKMLLQFEALAIYVKRGETLENIHSWGDDAELFRSLQIPVGQGISGWVAENREPLRNGNPSVEPGYLNDSQVFSIHRSAMAVPLDGAGGVIGVLTLYDRRKDAFSRDDLRILLAVASKLGLAVETVVRYQQAEDTALTDYLTGLPNARALFSRLREELDRSRTQNEALVVLLADLDGFKGVNDNFGHLAGNSILRGVAKALLQQCRDGDMVARLGGDEFVVVCPHLPAAKALDFAERLKKAVEREGQAQLGAGLLSASIGVSVSPEDGTEPEQLLAVADHKMYGNKQRAKAKSEAGLSALDRAVRAETEASSCEPKKAS